MRWLKATVAFLVLGTIVAAPPVFLLTYVGSPIPADLRLGMQLTDAAVIPLLSLLVWAFWLQTCWCIALETVATLTSGRLDRAPGTFGFQTLFARAMVGAIVAAFVSIPLLPPPAQASPAPAPAPTTAPAPPGLTQEPVPAPEHQARVEPAVDSDPDAATPVTTVTVERGDSLWALAETHLGDPERWTEIAQLNHGRTMTDGSTFTSEGLLRPGWTLDIPVDQPQPVACGDYTVQAGDTLSQIAADRVGDPDRYPEIFEASRHLEQPIPLSDPNLIYPGQILDLPDDTTSSSEPPAVAPSPSPEVAPSPPAEVPTPEPAAVPAPAIPLLSGATSSADGAEARTQEPNRPDNPGPAPASAQEELSDEADDERLPSWVWPSMICGGGLLAGALLVSVRQRRSSQRRARRPGMVPATPTAIATEAERSIATAGTTSVDRIELIDQLLRRTAATLTRAHDEIPDLAAVEITPTDIGLHLRTPAEAPSPWVTSSDSLLWTLSLDTNHGDVGPDPVDDPSPWPMLVTIGTDTHDGVWLLNLEGQILTVTGDAQKSRDFTRYIAAEIACNPWSRHTTLGLLGIGEELAPIDPDRITCSDSRRAQEAAEAVAHAVETIGRLDDSDHRDAPAARAAGTDPDVWGSRLLIIDGSHDRAELDQLADLIESHRGRTGAALLRSSPDSAEGLELIVDSIGHLTIPEVNLRLDGVGLTSAEATGCATLLTHLENTTDEPAPDLDGADPWAELMTATGSLRAEHRVDRSVVPIEPAESVLPAPDETYWSTSTTTSDDLNRVAPKVTIQTRQRIEDADPTLNADLEEWYSDDSTRPKLTLLGPVWARTSGKALDKRRPFYTELFAYLATRPFGATTDEVAAAFGVTPARTRTDINRLRDWLGVDPATSKKYLPDAREAPAAKDRGIGVYQVVDALVDLDLFRRLRLRGESSGPDGIDDLARALALVAGRPLDQLRTGGWGWMLEGTRLDQHAVCGIVDVAHVVVADKLARGDSAAARAAVANALMAAPDEEILLLDLAAALEAEGLTDEAIRIVRDEICNRSDDGNAPVDLATRTAKVLHDRPNLWRWASAGSS